MYSHREMTQRYAPPDIPARAWQAHEVRSALRNRDVSALLRLIQGHTGTSQARIATATGIGQGRLNEIFNGHRKVVHIDVMERLADGLAMPDDARVLFGLAPVHAATLTGHAEIAAVYPVQAEADRELREHATTAARLDLLAVRALGLVALNDSLLRGPLMSRQTPIAVRVLILDPAAPAAAIRAAEIGESRESFTAGIRLALARLAEFSGHPYVTMRTAVYSSLPTWRMVVFDGTLYVSAFAASSEGHRSGMYKLNAAADGVL